MKKIFLFMALCLATVFAAKAADEIYTVFVEATTTLTFYCDDKKSTHTEGTVETYDPINEPDKLRFIGYADKVTKAVINPSMKDTLLTSMGNMFYGGVDWYSHNEYTLEKLTTIEGLENLNTSNVTDMNGLFAGCNLLASLNISSFNTSKVTDMNSMFFDCMALESIPFGASFSTANVTDMRYMFAYCQALKSLDLSAFNTTKVTDMRNMFSDCSELETIYCNDDWSLNTTAVSDDMFKNCPKLKGGNNTTYDSNHMDAAYAHLDEAGNPGYFTKKTTTGLETVTNDQSPITNKIIKDNHLLILRDGKTYNVMGVEIR